MGRYWRTLRRFWGTAVAVQLEYQANVLIELLAVAMSLSGSLFLLSLFYGPDQTLGGWSWAQALMVQGFYTVFDGMATTWLAFAIAFLFQSLIAACCFWSEKASALERLQFIPFVFLSGLLAPLTAFPPGVRALAQWTPFPYLIDFPARVLAGQPVDLIAGFGAQLAWVAVLLPLVLLLWRAGVRRYSGMGA